MWCALLGAAGCLAAAVCLLFAAFAAVCWVAAKLRSRDSPVKRGLRVAFVHPDLGIGGAERLIVDAALALQRRGHHVVIHTAHHDPGHCFPETRGELRVKVRCDWMPRAIFRRCQALCAYVRMLGVACFLAVDCLNDPYDVIVCDLVSICVPLLQWLCRPRGVCFYCHYPDFLLAHPRGRVAKAYRCVLDSLEEVTTGMADLIFVNSRFTKGVFAEAFPRLRRRGCAPEVLYPATDTVQLDAQLARAHQSEGLPYASGRVLLSVNRFERKKNIELAVRAFHQLEPSLRQGVTLVLAGGYDPRVAENVEYAAELRALTDELGLSDQVVQRHSIAPEEKVRLLASACCLLYTPDREHFGIVPVEAMYCSTPVLAVNSGGPLETVVEGETGFLRPPEPSQWAAVMNQLLRDDELRARLGAAGHKRVVSEFALDAFGARLDAAFRKLAGAK